MQPINILYVNTPEITGGAEISLLTAIANLTPEHYRSSILTTPHSTLIKLARSNGIEPHIQSFPWLSRKYPWPYLKSILNISGLIRGLEIDLIHTNCVHSLPYVHRASFLTRKPYVSHVRDFVREWFQEPYLTALQGAQRVIANSQAIAVECERQGISAERISVIYNPVDLDRFRSSSDDLRQEIGIADGTLVIGIVGQIQEIKGHREFVEAAVQIASQIPDVMFLLVGQPPDDAGRLLEGDLKRRINASGHASKFRFLGYRWDVERVMQTLHIVAVPSWSEPFGRVAVEGMAAGKAVIGSNAGGLPEIITDRVDGLLVPSRDVAALANAILILGLNPQIRQALGNRARVSAERFAINQHTRRLEALYDEVLE